MTNQPNDSDNNTEMQQDFMTVSADSSASKDWKKANKKNERRRKTKKAVLITLIIICVLIIAAVSTFFILSKLGQNKLLNKDVDIDKDENNDAVIYDDSTILYKDVLYGYNENITGILFMGVDKEKLTENDSHGSSGQADTLILVTVDTSSGKTIVTSIPRDTITEVDIYSTSGGFLKTEDTQICLAYAYGDGKTLSCENTAKAVSELFMNMPINSYLSTDYSVVKKITDSLDGVTVTPNETFEADRSNYTTKYNFEKGIPAKLYGNNTLPYLRYRGNEASSSYLRMERQMDYLSAVSEKFISKTKENLGYPVSFYKKYAKNITSNLSADKITYLTSAVFSNRNDVTLDFKKIEGQSIIGEDGYAEFYPDETKLFELVLELFYQPLG